MELCKKSIMYCAMVPGKQQSLKPSDIYSIFKPLNSSTCRVWLGLSVQTKEDLYSSWAHLDPLIFSENLCLASHPLSCGNHWVGRLQFQCYTQAGHWKSGTPDTQLKLLDQIIDGLRIFLTYWDKAAKTDYPLVSEIKASFLSHCFFSPWLYFQIKCFYMCFDVIFNLFVETLLQMFR